MNSVAACAVFYWPKARFVCKKCRHSSSRSRSVEASKLLHADLRAIGPNMRIETQRSAQADAALRMQDAQRAGNPPKLSLNAK